MTLPDLTGCAAEPIRVPGAVQPHGVLLAVREPSLEVVVASANAEAVLGSRPATLHDLLGDDADRLATGDLAELDPLRWRDLDVVAHRADGLLVVELEPADDGRSAAWHRRLPLVLQRLQAAPDLTALADEVAAAVRELTGFDRVMVYRFDPDWNGEVVAERRREDLEPFLGLRYPASDIPPQARELYLTNWLRLIPDARYRPVPLVPDTGLDLSGAALRSVSPVHLEYLANMGVVASMSVSLVDDGRLWGLIACHHYAGPHRPSYTDRVTAEFLGRTASLLLATKVDAGDAERQLATAAQATRLAGQLAASPRRPVQALVGGPVTVLDLVPAGGAAVRLEGRLQLLGRTPPAARVAELLDAGATVTSTASADDLVADASGVLVVPVPGGGELAWFRPEVLREVTWGGDPTTSKVVEGEHGVRLSPRRSFAAWTQVVAGTAEPWRPHEVAAAEELARSLGEVTARQAGEESRLAAALQRTLLLAEVPELPGVALAARSVPSADDVVGGDWYDLVLLPSGRVSVVLGDVAGHGLGAAAITAQLRHALRAYLLQSAGPAAALQRLNELAAYLLPEELATLVVAELDPATGRLALASAGHLPVLLLTDGGATTVAGSPGPALGLNPAAQYREAVLELAAGDRVVVFSDGLVERHGEGVTFEPLLAAAAQAPRDVDALLDALLTALAPPGDDDVTLLALGPA